MTTLIAITYRGRTVAAASQSRFFLADVLEDRPPDDPERRFVVFMCAFAADVLNGALPGPYSEARARRFACDCLIPAELLERQTLDIARVAGALGFPSDRAHRSEGSASDVRVTRRRCGRRLVSAE